MNTTEYTKRDFEHVREQLRTVRDEIKLHAHLGSMELKDRWSQLEPKLYEAERYVDEISDATWAAGHDLLRRARALRDSLKEMRDNQRKVGPHTR